MAPITLEEAKQHLRVEHDEEDGYIETLIAVAGNLAQEYSGLSFNEDVPELAKHAIKMIIATLYEQREDQTAATVSQVPLCSKALLDLLRIRRL
ncbi:head-tail connector protein [Hahella aquimaris]|uniref:head-tail connector protein n=1 Tax=Hahella sp. HNIBRBA332 TaxID=3015983 RepID=UPI00273C52EE|nr:head-tail connector protein [Hahella sp. HNIBRBA332]WLQ15429.1 head-tail connector protein [Hahella sp. HNIBRBA332]